MRISVRGVARSSRCVRASRLEAMSELPEYCARLLGQGGVLGMPRILNTKILERFWMGRLYYQKKVFALVGF
jgi:hypothetical protein